MNEGGHTHNFLFEFIIHSSIHHGTEPIIQKSRQVASVLDLAYDSGVASHVMQSRCAWQLD